MKITLLILTLLLISSASATLILTPQPSDLTCKVATTCTNQITLTNNYSFPILDFNFEGLTEKGFTFPIINIPSNSTKTIDFTLHPTESFHGNLQVPVSFKYEVSLPEESRTHYVNITEYNFNPNHLDIRQDDTIVFTNIDTVSHTILSGSLFNQHLLPNETFSKIFNQVGEISYQDLNFYFGGTINVLNKTTKEKSHNTNYDIIWAINLNAILNPTNLSITNSKTDYEIKHTKSDGGMITIRNNGTEDAELITLTSTSDWISFNKNQINIEPGKESYVEYTIVPLVFQTNETDKNYPIDLKIKATNSQEYIESISVFIPHAEIYFDENDPEYLLKILEDFCNKNPGNVFCNPPDSTNDSITYLDTQIPLNLSATQFYEYLRRIQSIDDANSRTTNKLTQLTDKYSTFYPEIMNFLNQSVTMQEENEKKNKRFKNSVWIIGFFVVVITSILSVIKVVNKKSHKKDLMEGAYKYRK